MARFPSLLGLSTTPFFRKYPLGICYVPGLPPTLGIQQGMRLICPHGTYCTIRKTESTAATGWEGTGSFSWGVCPLWFTTVLGIHLEISVSWYRPASLLSVSCLASVRDFEFRPSEPQLSHPRLRICCRSTIRTGTLSGSQPPSGRVQSLAVRGWNKSGFVIRTDVWGGTLRQSEGYCTSQLRDASGVDVGREERAT